jgi:hypothetical protein
VALCGFAICGYNLLAICGLKTSASLQINTFSPYKCSRKGSSSNSYIVKKNRLERRLLGRIVLRQCYAVFCRTLRLRINQKILWMCNLR